MAGHAGARGLAAHCMSYVGYPADCRGGWTAPMHAPIAMFPVRRHPVQGQTNAGGRVSFLTSCARRALEKLLDRRGFRMQPKQSPPRGFAQFLALYRQFGPPPQAVFDIGVGHGTQWLYEAFPESYFVLVEALEDFRPSIDGILQRYRGESHYCALAEREGTIAMHVPLRAATGSSLLPRNAAWDAFQKGQGDRGTVERIVPVTTLDRIAAPHRGPHIVKIDVEGAELQVLRGGTACIDAADMLIVECSIAPRHVGESDFVDVAYHLKQRNFELTEIVEIDTYGRHEMMDFLDAVFIRRDNPFLSAVRPA